MSQPPPNGARPGLSCSLAFLILALAATPAAAQYNPSGWIEARAWGLLYPLTHRLGCTGGGPAAMRGAWTAPFDLGLTNPRPGDVWPIDFETAEATGWGGTAVAEAPEWTTVPRLRERFPQGEGFPEGARVDFQALADALDRAGAPVENDGVLGVAVTYVRNLAREPIPLELCLSSDDSVLVLVDNLPVFARSVCRPASPVCEDNVGLTLPTGVSKVTVLVWEGTGQHAFRLGFRKDGRLLADGNDFVAFLGIENVDAKGGIRYRLERDVESPDGKGCAPLPGCNEAWRVRLRGAPPRGFEGSPDDTVVIVEEVLPRSLAARDLKVTSVSGGGEVEEIVARPRAFPLCALPEGTFVGQDAGGRSGTEVDDRGTPNDLTDDIYQSISTSGGDIGEAGDHFEYRFAAFQGDFDVAVEVLASSHDTRRGRGGEFGLMARESLSICARFSMLADHLPDLRDGLEFVRRTQGDRCDAVGSFAGPGGSLAHPRFQRLTRRGNVVTGWVSNHPGLADGSAASCADVHWVKVFEDDWGENAPSQLLVGFANSEHESDGPARQEVRYRLLCNCAEQMVVGSRIRWRLARRDAERGLSYAVCSRSPGSLRLRGRLEDLDAAVPARGPEVLHIASPPQGRWRGCEALGSAGAPGDCDADGPLGIERGQGPGVAPEGDGLHLSWVPVRGDFDARVRIDGRVPPPHGGRFALHGLMAREDCDARSGFHFVGGGMPVLDGPVLEPVRIVRRAPHLDGPTVFDSHVLDDGALEGGQQPDWLRITRRGGAFWHWVADDAGGRPARWVLLGSSAAPQAAEELLVGVAVASDSGHPAAVLHRDFVVEDLDPPPDDGPACASLETLFSAGFSDDAGVAAVADRDLRDGAGPSLVEGRLRLLERESHSDAHAVWFETRGLSLGERDFRAEFDLYLDPGDAENVGDGITFALVAAGEGGAGDPFPETLDPASLVGFPGGALGYGGGAFEARVQRGHPSLAVEFDTWQGPSREHDPNGTNCSGCAGRFHVGLDLNGDVASVERHVDLGVENPPSPFEPRGVHVVLDWHAEGRVEVRLAPGGGGEETTVLSAAVLPFEGELLCGFTGATGGATLRAEVDDLRITSLCCEEPDAVRVEGPGTLLAGETVELQAEGMGLDPNTAARFDWEVVRGPVRLIEPTDEAAVRVRGLEGGEAEVAVTFGDGRCTDPARATKTLVVDDPACPGEGDTHCLGLAAEPLPEQGDDGALAYRLQVEARDDSGDEALLYLYRVRRSGTGELVREELAEEPERVLVLPPGEWELSVVVDDDPDCDDRAADAACAVDVVVPASCDGAIAWGDTAEPTVAPGEPVCLRVLAPPGGGGDRVGEVVLRNPGGGPAGILRARFGRPPWPGAFDFLAAEPGAARQRIAVPGVGTADLWLLVQASPGGGARPLRVETALLDLAVDGMVPSRAAARDTLVAAVHGAGLDRATGFTLVPVDGGPDIPGDAGGGSPERVRTGFRLEGAAPGIYDLRVEGPTAGVEAVLPRAFEVLEDGDGPRFVARIRAQASYRRRRLRSLEIFWRNAGDTGIDAPRLRLEPPEGTGTELGLPGGGPLATGDLVFPAGDPDAAEGRLPPGDEVRQLVHFRAEDVGMGHFDLRREATGELVATAAVTIIGSRDPNTKEGPVGEGDQDDLLDPGQEVAYSVHFENLPPPDAPETGAPAQSLEVIDAIDADYDLDRLELGPVTIGTGEPVELGPLLPCLSGGPCREAMRDVTVTNSLGSFPVRIRASIDTSTRVLTWQLTSLGLSTLPDTAGFLAVGGEDDTAGEGQGSVVLAAEPEDTKAPETEVSNEATITFDFNTDESVTTNRVTHFLVRPPGAPGKPVPPDRADPPVPPAGLTLEWDAGDFADTHDVWLWADGEEPTRVARDLKGTTFTPAGIRAGTLYRWMVSAVNRAGTTDGPVWTFRTVSAEQDPAFVRGDADASGVVDITDAIFILDWLFQGGRTPPCLDAADVDDDAGSAPNITDAIVLLGWLFQGGAPPPPPSPSVAAWSIEDCGTDPENPSDRLDCARFPPCP